MPELFDEFEKLEKELRQHIKRLRIQAIQIRWEQRAAKSSGSFVREDFDLAD
jgi:formamidopyrimidine-DNA glycosylase